MLLATELHSGQLQRAVKSQRMLQLAGLQFHGQQHRALEDARNTARLLPLILAD